MTRVLLLVLLLAACGGDVTVVAEAPPTSAPTTVAPTTTTSTSTTTTTTAPPPPPADGVALTFDADLTPGMQRRLRDGRVPSYANMAVIDILHSTGTPATVFFTGLWMEEYPEQTAAIAADPLFELATHSHTHRAFRADCYGLAVVPPEEMLDEVRRPVEALRRISPRATDYFRFPGLCHDDASLSAATAAGVEVIDGDASGDAGGTSVDTIVDQTVSRAHAGSIIVMHLNGGDRAPLTDDALPRILDGLRAKGLRPVALSELLRPVR